MLSNLKFRQVAVVEMTVQAGYRVHAIQQHGRSFMLRVQVPDDGVSAQGTACRYNPVPEVNRQDDSVGRSPQQFASGSDLVLLPQIMR